MRIYFTNANGAGPAIPHDVPAHFNAGTFFGHILPEGNPTDYDITVDGNPVRANHQLAQGSNVIFARRGQPIHEAHRAQAPVVTPRARVTFTYLNTITGGFAEERTVDAGTTYDTFLRERRVDVQSAVVRIRTRASVGASNPALGYVLRDGDTLTVTPSNLSGA